MRQPRSGQRHVVGDLHRVAGGPLRLQVERRRPHRAVGPHVQQVACLDACFNRGHLDERPFRAALEIDQQGGPGRRADRGPDHEGRAPTGQDLVELQSARPPAQHRDGPVVRADAGDAAVDRR